MEGKSMHLMHSVGMFARKGLKRTKQKYLEEEKAEIIGSREKKKVNIFYMLRIAFCRLLSYG